MGNSARVMGFYDVPMWESIENKAWALQYCPVSDRFRYPPSPVCPETLSMEYEWRPIKGTGEIISWVVFHSQYFDDHPAPSNNIAVRLDEGPLVISKLVGELPEDNWIGRRVEVVYVEHLDFTLPCMKLV